jgi:hypothetical protein
MEPNLLLESHLKALRLPSFVQNYRRFAQDAIRTQQSYDRFLLALAEQVPSPTSTSSASLTWPGANTSPRPARLSCWATRA